MSSTAKKQVVFQGGAEQVVSKKMLEDRETRCLNGAVASIFAKYPFRAGQSAPVALPEN